MIKSQPNRLAFYHLNAQNNKFFLPELNNGLYLMLLKTNDKLLLEKINIQH
jgi:hypothetical protein